MPFLWNDVFRAQMNDLGQIYGKKNNLSEKRHGKIYGLVLRS